MSTFTQCPFLVPVVADWLWVYQSSAYCARPDHRVRVPANRTLTEVCTSAAHLTCEGYRASQQGANRPESADS